MLRRSLVALGVLAALVVPSVAHADDAVVDVQGPAPSTSVYAAPPPGRNQPIEPSCPPACESRPYREDPPYSSYDHKRSPIRLALGPSFLTTGKGVGVGLGLGIELGSGVVGGRLGATWLRGEGTKDGVVTPTGDAVGHYVGELTLDIVKRGPFHPVVAVGGGVLHVSRPDTSGVVAVGTVRASLEYFAPIEDADVRIGVDATGGLAGPGAEALRDVKGYGLFGVHAALGF